MLGVYREQLSSSVDELGIFAGEGSDTEERIAELVPKKKSEKKNIPFNSKAGRDEKERPKTSIGPGYYNIVEQNKPS